MLSTLVFSLAALILPTLAFHRHKACPPECFTRVFQFEDVAYQIENLAVRPNGNVLLATAHPAAAVYQIDPRIGNASLEVVASNAQLDGAASATSIAELSCDLFAVISGNFSTPGTFTIHTIDFSSSGSPPVQQTNAIDDALLLNGLARVEKPGILLASDSYLGRIYRIDTTTGQSEVVLEGIELEAVPGSTGVAAIAANGIRTLGRHLYFINSSKHTFSRVAITSDGHVASSPEVIADLSAVQTLPDDFAITRDGAAFIAGSDELVYVDEQGRASVLLGGPGVETLAGDTSAQFGRQSQKDTVFVSGGVPPANGVAQEPGYVEALRVECLKLHHG